MLTQLLLLYLLLIHTTITSQQSSRLCRCEPRSYPMRSLRPPSIISLQLMVNRQQPHAQSHIHIQRRPHPYKGNNTPEHATFFSCLAQSGAQRRFASLDTALGERPDVGCPPRLHEQQLDVARARVQADGDAAGLLAAGAARWG